MNKDQKSALNKNSTKHYDLRTFWTKNMEYDLFRGPEI